MATMKPHEELRQVERRLRAALPALRARWTLNGREFGDALVCRDVLRRVRFERRRHGWTTADFFLALWMPQIDMLCRDAAKGGLCVQAA